MSDILIEQAIYTNADAGGYRFVARSEGFADDWLHEAERLCTGFGERPADVACPGCVFAQPFGRQHVAVVQVADQGTDDAGRPGALGFRFLIFPRNAYHTLVADPFLVADSLPPTWQARDRLPTLPWPGEPAPARSVQQLDQVLKNGDSVLLLGAVQGLVDGGRVFLERPAPDADVIRGIWMLLPGSTRAEIWPATFAFANTLHFDILAMPRKLDDESYLTEERARDYPQSSYEHDLQVAVEHGNQREVDRLLSRRSSLQTMRLAFFLVAALALAGFVFRASQDSTPPQEKPRPVPIVLREPPLKAKYPTMSADEAKQVLANLKKLMQDLSIPQPRTNPSIDDLLKAIDKKLGSPDPERHCELTGQRERRLRTLLWKHHVDAFDDPNRNPVELVERLREKLVAQKKNE